MGFYLRKRIKVAPGLNVNLSKSGVGVSAGVKGFRVSKGPRGTQLNAGRYGVYYRKQLAPPRSRSRSAPLRVALPSSSSPIAAGANVVAALPTTRTGRPLRAYYRLTRGVVAAAMAPEAATPDLLSPPAYYRKRALLAFALYLCFWLPGVIANWHYRRTFAIHAVMAGVRPPWYWVVAWQFWLLTVVPIVAIAIALL